MARADSRAVPSDGSSSDARIAMIAMTTSSSMSVNRERAALRLLTGRWVSVKPGLRVLRSPHMVSP